MACKTEVIKIPESERFASLVTYEQDLQFMRNTQRNLAYEEGYRQGFSEGIIIGQNKAIQEFVKKTLADNVPINKIAKYASLSESEVKAIAAKLNQQKNINQPL